MNLRFSVKTFRSTLSLGPLALLLLAGGLAAQEEEEKTWELSSELGASIFFGASEQTSFLFRNDFSQEKDDFELRLTNAFDYGEAQASPGEPGRVNQRSWLTTAEVDYSFGRWSPFVFGTGEGSLQRQIDLRLAGGAGIKYTLVDTERTSFDVSAAVQGERTDPREAEGVPGEIVTLARSSNRVRFKQEFGEDRATFTQVIFYKPALGDSEDYTVDSETSLAFNLNTMFSFKASLVNRYDNLAESRGAVSNNDGRVFFAIVATH